ncbi:MAG: dynamin family protein [Saprospiraceae bacterium]|nr:dynamin family protein [Saprospiraceae bacterium]MBK8852218.1 dynamin family protein [Saprospiraceae bacterium]MBK9687881.1 dynamin family protein [Saprospiraceae bacterium]
MKNSIDPKIVEISSQLSLAIARLEKLTADIDNTGMNETVRNLHLQLEAPFTFVIVGEVKAGKSSFINALLETEKEICKVAPSPMTDTIQQIVYGPEESSVFVTDYIKKITQPVDILKEIAIVDTPGTNTIVAHHQEITEKFIPYSDLIVFVFEAKNPYRQSAWDFFDYINSEWRRKVIFVLQQKDLLNEGDLAINKQGVLDHAQKKGLSFPQVFAVSAKQELEGDKKNSGFEALRLFISENITGGKAPYLKLANSTNTAQRITDTISHALHLRSQQFELDRDFREDIRETLANQEKKTQYQVGVLAENLLATYDKITQKKSEELGDGLSFVNVLKRSFSSLFGTESGLKDWLNQQSKDFELQLNTQLKDKLHAGITDVADNIQLMGKLVDAKIKTNKTVLEDTDDIFADIAERRANVLKDLQQSFSQFMNKSENFYDETLLKESGKMTPNLAAGGGMAVVGVMITALVNGAVFDITGGILTTVGLIFAGVTLGLNKSKIVKRFKEEVTKGRIKMEEEVRSTLNDYTTRIKNRIEDNFRAFDQHLANEEENLGKMKTLKDEASTLLEQVNRTLLNLLK